jgi:hypothetical protein
LRIGEATTVRGSRERLRGPYSDFDGVDLHRVDFHLDEVSGPRRRLSMRNQSGVIGVTGE